MYKKLTTWSMFLLLFAATSAAAELKIAVLDTQRALVESEEAQALLAQAQTELQAEQDQLQALNNEIVALTEQLQKDGEVMSPAEQRRPRVATNHAPKLLAAQPAVTAFDLRSRARSFAPAVGVPNAATPTAMAPAVKDGAGATSARLTGASPRGPEGTQLLPLRGDPGS